MFLLRQKLLVQSKSLETKGLSPDKETAIRPVVSSMADQSMIDVTWLLESLLSHVLYQK
jgi:hypothetical protein